MRVRVRFECLQNLPKDPVGVGHKVMATAAVLAEKEPLLGRAPGQCHSQNIVDLTLTGGIQPVSCVYCGTVALQLFGRKDGLVVREIAGHVSYKGIEVVDGGDEA